MGHRRRYIGTSHLFNVGRNHEFRNGLDIRLDDDQSSVEINSAIEPERRISVVTSPEEARFVRKWITTMEREDMRAKRQAGQFAFFKKKKRRKPHLAPVCQLCGGYGGNEDDDGNWVECRTCSGQM